MNESAGKIIHYLQLSLYNGKKANEEGFYCFSRKQLAEGANISPGTVARNMDEVISYLSDWCDLSNYAGLKQYAGECLYTNVAYNRGVLQFKRNTLTCMPELSFLWALPPIYDWFSYDVFDEKHRRRHNGSTMIYDSVPWTWDADQYEEEIQAARATIQAHWRNEPVSVT